MFPIRSAHAPPLPRCDARSPPRQVVAPRCPIGIAAIDTVLGGGVAQGRMHEVYASGLDDAAGAIGFAALLAATLAGGKQDKSLAWLRDSRVLRSSGVLQARGLIEHGGIIPSACLFVLADNGRALLRAGLDIVRCTGLGTAIIETHGPLPELDLTASRRLALAAESSGITLLVLRIGAEPVPSAAQTRWSAASAPSRALHGNAPGASTFDITLLRQRSGPSGMGWRLEWDRDRRMFRETKISDAVVSVPVGRSVADRDGRPAVRAA